MVGSRITGRYAKSLIDLAIEKNQLEEVNTDISTLSELLRVPDFALLLKSPVITPTKKNEIVKIITGERVSKITQAFVELLINKGREPELAGIVSEFQEQYRTFKKIRIGTLITAEKLSATEVENIRSKFQSWLKAGETLQINEKVDASIIGGFIMELGDKQYDASVKRQITAMRKGLEDKSYINLVINK